MSAPRISVALVTRNRPGSLRRCLESWSAQQPAPFEIVVSDDSDDVHFETCRRIAEGHGCRHIRGPRRGLYANRNNASLACTGTHVLSADDDHTHPPGFVETLLALAERDPHRIWILTERHPSNPHSPLTCPPELHRSGNGIHPADPDDCAAISDGASLYPVAVFAGGLRYDETYRFGALWYLWGLHLRRSGWRMSFSDLTWVIHHNETDGRLTSLQALRDQLEVMQYALFVRSLHLDRSLSALFWAAAYGVRRCLFREGVVHYRGTARPGFRVVLRAGLAALRTAAYDRPGSPGSPDRTGGKETG